MDFFKLPTIGIRMTTTLIFVPTEKEGRQNIIGFSFFTRTPLVNRFLKLVKNNTIVKKSLFKQNIKIKSIGYAGIPARRICLCVQKLRQAL